MSPGIAPSRVGHVLRGQLVAQRDPLHRRDVEQPSLFASPLPPRRELLPLPEDLRPSDQALGRSPDLRAVIVEVPMPLRVHEELRRRADLRGELLPDYLALLLGVAADRVQLAPPTYERFEPYGGSYRGLGADVIELEKWVR